VISPQGAVQPVGAPGKPGEGGSHAVADGNPQWVPAGRLPHGKGEPPAGTECCVVLGVTPAAKRAQGVWEPRYGASKRTFGGSRCRQLGRRQHRSADMRGAKVPPGSESAANAQGGPPGIWEILPSPAVNGRATRKHPGSRTVSSTPARANNGATPVTAKRRKRSAAGRSRASPSPGRQSSRRGAGSATSSTT